MRNGHGLSQSDQAGIGLTNTFRQLYVIPVVLLSPLMMDWVITRWGVFAVTQWAFEFPLVIEPLAAPPLAGEFTAEAVGVGDGVVGVGDGVVGVGDGVGGRGWCATGAAKAGVSAS